MGKTITVPIDNFSQSGELTLQQIVTAAAAASGNAAKVIRDPSTGKVIEVNVNLPDNVSQSAIDAITNNKGVAQGQALVFPTVIEDEKFDALSAGAIPADDTAWQYFRTQAGIGAASDFSVSGANSLKIPTIAGAGTQSFGVLAVGEHSTTFLADGRTVETEAKIRFSADSGLDLVLGPNLGKLFVDSGDLRLFNLTGPIVVSGLATDTFHTIRTSYVIRSDTITVTVNGVPKGSFTDPVLLNQTYQGILLSGILSLDLWMDDMLITGIA